MNLFLLIKKIIEDPNYIEYLRHINIMCDMAFMAERDGFKKEIIVLCFLYRIGYLLDILSLDILYKKDYGIIGYNYLFELGYSKKIIDIISKYSQIKNIDFQCELQKNINYGTFIMISYYESVACELSPMKYGIEYDFNEKLNYYFGLSEQFKNLNAKNVKN